MEATITTCKNCGNQFSGKYCNACGEQFYTDKDKSIKHLVEEAFHFVTHFQGNFLFTVKTILTKPGQFSFDYCSGIRKKYFKPLSFFLLLVVIYLLFPVSHGLNMKLNGYLQANFYGGYASRQIKHLITEKGMPATYVFDHFQNTSEKVSKILLPLLIPVMALWSMLLVQRQKRFYFDHFIFSAEINSFLLLWGFLLIPLLQRLLVRTVNLFTPFDYFPDIWFGSFVMGSVALFTLLSARRFYGLGTWKAILFTIGYVGVYIIVVQYLYKFLLFYITVRFLH